MADWKEDWLVHRYGFNRQEKHCSNPLIRPYLVRHKQFRDMDQEKKLFNTWHLSKLYGHPPKGFKKKVLEILNSSNLELVNISRIYQLESSFSVLMGAQIIGPIRGLHHFVTLDRDEMLVFRASKERDISLQTQAARIVANTINSKEELKTFIQQQHLPQHLEDLISDIL